MTLKPLFLKALTKAKANSSYILEIWEYECNIGRSDRKPESSEAASVKEMFLELKRDINDLKIEG